MRVARLSRRKFLGRAVSSGAGMGLLMRAPGAWAGAHASIDVLVNEPIGTISPDLYGYLLENGADFVYGGAWVGEKSKIPNIGGIRKELIERMREMRASVIRWPGGNFADYYDWKDGIGPRSSRPRRTNRWTARPVSEVPPGAQRYDSNEFGTHEFLQLCTLTGGRPFINANVRALSPQDFSHWLEYCNAPAGTTTLAEQRTTNGSAEPFNVSYWGIGNEPWAFGGDMTAEEYADFYKRFALNLPQFATELKLIACGAPPPVTDTDWVRKFLRSCTAPILPPPIHAVSIHYYSTQPLERLPAGVSAHDLLDGDGARWWSMVSDASRFDAADWYESLSWSADLDRIIDATWKTMGEFDPKRTIKIAVDEWGAFYKDGAKTDAAESDRAVTLRDALAAAVTLDTLHNRCEKVTLANFTGLINHEGGIFKAADDKFVATPIYHVFKMYSVHQGARAVRTVFDAPSIRYEKRGRSDQLWGLRGSASITGRELTLTVVNPHVSEAREATVTIRGGQVKSATVTTLTHADIHAQNTFEAPAAVKPTSTEAKMSGSTLHYRFPAASVTQLSLSLVGGAA
jgi:alpha-L-arabinofuranosidase